MNAPHPRRNGSSPAGGFTLMELMVAMGLFALLSTALVTFLARSTSLLAQGNSGVDTMDSLQLAAETVEKDVATLFTARDADVGMPDVRLFSDFVACKFDADDDRKTAGIQRLFFVRLIPHEATAPLTRNAGSEVVGPSERAYLDQKDDAIESAEKRLRATGGLMEVFYAAVPNSLDDPAVMTLYRGIRSPIGGPGSLLPTRRASDPAADPELRGPVHKKEIEAVAEPLLSTVLYFGVEFWSRKTQTWDHDIEPPRGPSRTWDSSRGILPYTKDTAEYFFLSKSTDPGGSLVDPVDDTFPRKIRLTVTVEEVGREASVGNLSASVGPDEKFLPLLSTAFIPASEGRERFVKIGTEWIQFEAPGESGVSGCKRGVRGTLAQAHAADARVHHGRTLHREFDVATFRDTYQDDLGSKLRIR